MKIWTTWAVLVSIAASVAALLPLGAVAAGTPRISPRLYPVHAQLSVISPLSNQAMDCDWGFVCQRNQSLAQQPLFHLNTEDALHRVSGWAQFGQVRTNGREMLFALYVSHYADGQDTEGLPWSLRAFADFRGTNLSHGFSELTHDPVLVPHGVLGNSGAQIARSPSEDVLALSCWAESIEVEAVAIYVHGSRGARTLALRDLTRQVRSAVSQTVSG